MALVNPNIAMGYRGVEIPNQLAQYAQLSAIQNAQQANQLNQLKMEEYQLEKKNKNALSAAYAQSFDPTSGKVDYNKLTGLLAQGGQGVNIPAVLKQRTEEEKALTEEAARRAKLMQDTQTMYQNMTGQIRNKADAATFLQRMVNDPALKDSPLTRIPLMEQVQRIPEDPQGLDNWVKQFSLGATKYITENKPVTFSQDTGAGGRVMSRPGLGGTATVVPSSEFTKSMTFADKNAVANLNLAQQRLGVEQQRVGLEGQRVGLALQEAERKTQGLEALPPKEIQKREAAFPQATSALKGFDTKSDSFMQDLIKLRDHPGLGEITGFAAGRLPGITANGRAAQALYDKVVAKGGFQALQDMRDASKTGGALGNVSNQEGKQLTASFEAIDRRQDAKDVQEAINNAIQSIEGSKVRMREAYDMTYGYKNAQPTAPANVVTNPKFPGFSVGK
jgi:hypothetical protein